MERMVVSIKKINIDYYFYSIVLARTQKFQQTTLEGGVLFPGKFNVESQGRRILSEEDEGLY